MGILDLVLGWFRPGHVSARLAVGHQAEVYICDRGQHFISVIDSRGPAFDPPRDRGPLHIHATVTAWSKGEAVSLIGVEGAVAAGQALRPEDFTAATLTADGTPVEVNVELYAVDEPLRVGPGDAVTVEFELSRGRSLQVDAKL